MQMTTVFDGILPASLNPGVDPGATVVVWTPTRDGIYLAFVKYPDEPGAPFNFNEPVAVDLDNAGGPTCDPIIGGGPMLYVENAPDAPAGKAALRLSPDVDHDVRAVVQIGVLAYADGVTPGETSIVPLDELKLALGLDPLDTADDLLLTLLESQAAAYVEAQLGRRFSAPIEKVEFVKGLGVETLFLGGHIAGDPAVVAVRSRALSAREFDDVLAEDYMIRGDTLVLLGSRWSHLYEYEVTYSDGYDLGSAPADIRALVTDLVSVAFSSLGEEGVKSESIGDYSYTLDSSVTAAAASLSSESSATMNRYRRVSL